MDAQQTFYFIILIGTLLVFISDSIGNMLSFGNRIANAFTTAIVWGILFIALYFVLGSIGMELASSLQALMITAAKGILLVFVADLIGNAIAFGNRFINALVTAIVWSGLMLAYEFYGKVILTGLTA